MLACAAACGGDPPGEGAALDPDAPSAHEATAANGPGADTGEPVVPPFAVSGDLRGLLLVWFDEQGMHTASSRDEIPEARRQRVRVDSLAVAPDARLDAEHVYVADLRAPGEAGRYPVRKHTRAWFEAQADALVPAPPAGGDVTLYMASWCGACKAAAAYFDQKRIAYSEKDIEKDPAAQAEMQQKARAAGKSPRGVPVIDFRGEIVLGFDRATLDRLIAEKKPI